MEAKTFLRRLNEFPKHDFPTLGVLVCLHAIYPKTKRSSNGASRRKSLTFPRRILKMRKGLLTLTQNRKTTYHLSVNYNLVFASLTDHRASDDLLQCHKDDHVPLFNQIQRIR
ncbi:hypothetical protein J6590_010849 [Homalodisca vitripennis]|nr:hypothetical protein J6590_010849 [Homalodisca vitripennis]